MKFCGECGAELTLVCPNCTAPIPHSSNSAGSAATVLPHRNIGRPPKDLSFDEKLAKIQKYLPSGLTEKILSQRDRIEGERRHVTIMFIDMKGFTPLTERLGPEETFTLMDQVFEILIHKIHDYEGTVNELRGDGVLALFGAPIALEDAPQRAIRSALAMHREMTKFSETIKVKRKFLPFCCGSASTLARSSWVLSEMIFESNSPLSATPSIWRPGWSKWLSPEPRMSQRIRSS